MLKRELIEMSDQASGLSWGHINLNVRDLEASVAFYEGLGFEILMPSIPYLGIVREGEASRVAPEGMRALKLPDGTSGRGCILRLGSGFPMLDLTEWTGRAARAPLANEDRGLVRICLASQNLGEDYERLTARGVPFLSTPQICQGGMAEIAVCSDPDGSMVELIQVQIEKWAVPNALGTDA